jgi:protein-tyrosine phosphatase
MDITSVLAVTHNSRELGGLPLADGGVVVSGVLFRSDALNGLTDEGVHALGELGIGTVVDLRTEGERSRAADVLPADGSVRFVALPVLGGAMDEMVKRLLPATPDATSAAAPIAEAQLAEVLAQVPTLEELYVAILSSSAAQFADLAREVVAAALTDRPGVLFHCTAGKDRTGLAAALLLPVAGASRAVIVDDYTLTSANLARGLGTALTGLITSLGVPLTPRLETLATKSTASDRGRAGLDRGEPRQLRELPAERRAQLRRPRRALGRAARRLDGTCGLPREWAERSGRTRDERHRSRRPRRLGRRPDLRGAGGRGRRPDQ